MGWGYGVDTDGREIGYNVEAVCDAVDCDVKIDRGLAYACGGYHGYGELYCSGYFCDAHLTLSEKEVPSDMLVGFICESCAVEIDKDNRFTEASWVGHLRGANESPI